MPTHRAGELARNVAVGAAAIMRVAAGTITDSWIFADKFGLLRQFGAPAILTAPDRKVHSRSFTERFARKAFSSI